MHNMRAMRAANERIQDTKPIVPCQNRTQPRVLTTTSRCLGSSSPRPPTRPNAPRTRRRPSRRPPGTCPAGAQGSIVGHHTTPRRRRRCRSSRAWAPAGPPRRRPAGILRHCSAALPPGAPLAAAEARQPPPSTSSWLVCRTPPAAPVRSRLRALCPCRSLQREHPARFGGGHGAGSATCGASPAAVCAPAEAAFGMHRGAVDGDVGLAWISRPAMCPAAAATSGTACGRRRRRHSGYGHRPPNQP